MTTVESAMSELPIKVFVAPSIVVLASVVEPVTAIMLTSAAMLAVTVVLTATAMLRVTVMLASTTVIVIVVVPTPAVAIEEPSDLK